MLVDQDPLILERDRLLSERDSMAVERDSMAVERDNMSVERDNMESDKWDIMKQLREVEDRLVRFTLLISFTKLYLTKFNRK